MALNILLVDDDTVQAATRRAVLERAGHIVRVAADGSAALGLLRSREGRFIQMVVTDHLMPGMNGPEFVATARTEGFRFPILVLSGFADADDEYDGLDVTFRIKPFPPDQLIALVQYLFTLSERRTA